MPQITQKRGTCPELRAIRQKRLRALPLSHRAVLAARRARRAAKRAMLCAVACVWLIPLCVCSYHDIKRECHTPADGADRSVRILLEEIPNDTICSIT